MSDLPPTPCVCLACEIRAETRTQQGYAYWKEIPSAVKAAREWAELYVAVKNLRVAIMAPLEALYLWIDRKMGATK